MMKKIISFLIAGLFSVGAFAQNPAPAQPYSYTNTVAQHATHATPKAKTTAKHKNKHKKPAKKKAHKKHKRMH